MDPAAALDHEPPDSPYVAQVRPAAAASRCRRRTQRPPWSSPSAQARSAPPLLRRIDDLLAARAPELRRRVEVAGAADRDLQGVLRLPGGNAGGPPRRRVDQQPRVVGANGARADEDRVHGGPHLVDPVEVGRAGEQQALGPGVVQVAVEGDGGGQQDVRVRHRRGPVGRRRTARSGSWFKFETNLHWGHDDSLAHPRGATRLARVHRRDALLEDALDRQLQQDAGMPHLYYSILAILSEPPGTPAAHDRSRRAAEDHPQPADVRGDPPGEGRPAAARGLPVGQAGQHRRADRRGDGRTGAAPLPGMSRPYGASLFDRLTEEQVAQLEEICTRDRAGLRRATTADAGRRPDDVSSVAPRAAPPLRAFSEALTIAIPLLQI